MHSAHARHTFGAFLLCKDLKKHRKNTPKGVLKWSPTEATGGSKSMAGAMFQRHLEKMRSEKKKRFTKHSVKVNELPIELNLGTPSSQTLLPFC